MQRRLLDVTRYTTLDFVTATATGPDWTDEAPAVVDVTRPDDDAGVSETVELSLELDATETVHLPHHATHLALTPHQARVLADDLRALAAEADGGAATD